jgi:hypothetical protein
MLVKIEDLEARISRVEDYIAINQLQSRYTHYMLMGAWKKIHSCFVQKTPGLEMEIADCGVFEGLDAPKRYFARAEGPKFPGDLTHHMAVNPVIEINKEGTRAKGVWHSPGIMTVAVNDKLTAHWYFGKYFIEYVKEDGEWKFLKFQFCPIFCIPYHGEGWVDGNTERIRWAPPPKSDRPSTPGFYHPYKPDKTIVFGPFPPEPYED